MHRGKVIGFRGTVEEGDVVDVVAIGCGSHSFRNIYPCLQFLPVRLKAVCDLDGDKAEAFAAKLGAGAAYTDHRRMLDEQRPDLVLIVTGYDAAGRPLHAPLAGDCVAAGAHVFIEKPPAADVESLEALRTASERAGRTVMTGFKKMFFPGNRKAAELMQREEFGTPSQALLEYPQYVPSTAEMEEYRAGAFVRPVVSFLDHLCHPASLMVYLLGSPTSLLYLRNEHGAGSAHFEFPGGMLATISFTHGVARAGGFEFTKIISRNGMHITVENGCSVRYHRGPALAYGASPDFAAGAPEEVTAIWEPEFSLGQLYNKGLFLLGYYHELEEVVSAIREDRALRAGTLDQAIMLTRIFDAFAQGPRKTIELRSD